MTCDVSRGAFVVRIRGLRVVVTPCTLAFSFLSIYFEVFFFLFHAASLIVPLAKTGWNDHKGP